MKLAAFYGAKAARVETPDELAPALEASPHPGLGEPRSR
ncbi:hypothetical protein [Rhizobium aegyptiacum]